MPFKKTLLSVSILTLIIIAAFFVLTRSRVYAQWWNDSWKYRIAIPVTKTVSAENNVYIAFDGTDVLNTSASGKFQADCGDIRFTKENGELLPYYINSGCGTASTDIDVFFSSLPTGTSTIYMYYGNPSVYNGFSDSAFSTEATNYTFGTIGNEEKSPNPLHFWKLDEKVDNTCVTTDSDICDSGNDAIDGTRTGATWKSESFCLQGGCLELDGSDDYVPMDSSISLERDSFTVSAWFRTDSIADDKIFSINVSYHPLQIYNGTLRICVNGCSAGATTVNDQRWHHAVVVGDSTSIRAYLDGNLEITQTAATGTMTGTPAIGATGNGSPSLYFDGFIDEVKVYEYARTVQQIRSDYTMGAGPQGSTAAIGYPSAGFLTDGLIGYWPLDESSGPSADYSGREYSATWNGDAASGAGRFDGGIVQADGSGGYLSVSDTGDPFDMGSENFSLSLWVKPDSLSSPDAPELIDKMVSATTGYHLRIGYNDEVEFQVKGTGGDVEINSENGAITTGEWYHIAAVYDKQNGHKIFINGKQSGATVFGDAGNIDNTDNLRIGVGFNGWELDGAYDEVRIYNRVLSPSEVSKLFAWSPDPVAYWNFNENGGSTAFDRSGNALNGVAAEGTPEMWHTARKTTDETTTLTGGATRSNWATYLTTDIVPSETSDWIVFWAFKCSSQSTSNSCELRVDVNTTQKHGGRRENEATSSERIMKGFLILENVSSTQTIDLLYSSPTSGTAYADFASVVAFRLDTGDAGVQWAFDETDTTQTVSAYGTNTPDDLASVTINPASSGDYLIVGTFKGSEDDNTDSINFGISQDDTLIEPDDDTNPGRYHEEPPNAADDDMRMIWTVENLTTGSKTFALEARKEGSGNVNWSAEYSRLAVIRLSDVYTYTYEETLTDNTNGSGDGLEDLESVTFTADDADYAMFSSVRGAMTDNATTMSVYMPDSDESSPHEYFSAKDPQDFADLGFIDYKTLTSGSQTIELQGQYESGGSPATFDNAKILLLKELAESPDTAPDYTAGKYGSSAEFNGSTDYYQVTDNDTLTPRYAATWTGWIYLNSLPSTTGNHYRFYDKTGGGVKSHYMEINMSNIMRLYFSDDGSTVYGPLQSDSALTSHKWYHYAIIWDGNEVRMYLDGVLQSSPVSLSGLFNNTVDLYLGMDNEVQYHLDGRLDDVRLYSYARTQKEIKTDLNAGHPPGGSPVGSQIGYWKFDEAWGDTAYDQLKTNNMDLGGSGQTCPATGTTPCPAWTPTGKINGSLTFDGTDDYIYSSTEDSYETPSKTIAFWAKPANAITATIPIVSLNAANWYVGFANSSRMIASHSTSAPVQQTSYSANNSVTVGEWHHYAYTFAVDGSNVDVSFYKDGQLLETDSYTSGYSSSYGTEVIIGAFAPTSNFYEGALDEVKIYNYALTRDEILIDMNANAAVNLGTGVKEEKLLLDGSGAEPLVYYPLNSKKSTSTVYDLSGNNFTGTLNGSITDDDWVQGYTGSALDLDGSDDYIDSSATPLPTGDFTYMAWIKRNSTGSLDTIFMISNGSGGNEFILTVDTDNALFARIDGVGVIDGAQTLTTDTWYHVAITRNANAVTFYLNGVVDDTGSSTATMNFNGCQLLIGTDNDSSGCTDSLGDYFDGIIDEIKVYDYARTPAQIAQDYNRGKPMGWWKFDACEGNTAYDASGNDNHGTITIGVSGNNTAAGTCSSGAGTDAWFNGSAGAFNASISLDGSDDSVSVSNPDIDDYSTGPMSVTAWIKTSASGSQMQVVDNKTAGTNNAGFNLQIDADGYPYFRIANGSSQNLVQVTDLIVNDGNWHHLAGTLERSGGTYDTLKIYIDGNLVNTNASVTAGWDISSSQTLIIGAYGTGTNQANFNGLIDDVRLYNYALSRNKILQIMNYGAVRFE